MKNLEELKEQFLGMFLKEFQTYDLNYRIVKEDGINFFVTSDIQKDRMSLTIEDGKISNFYLGSL